MAGWLKFGSVDAAADGDFHGLALAELHSGKTPGLGKGFVSGGDRKMLRQPCRSAHR
jgi:hypothetical protein